MARTFALWQALGVHVTLNSFYSPIPDTRNLAPKLWDTPDHIVGIDMRDNEQIKLLAAFVRNYRQEYTVYPLDRDDSTSYFTNNPMFGSVDGEVLYCMIRYARPRHLIEIGSGMSTLIAADAVTRNADEGHACEFTTIDPYPPPYISEELRGLTRQLIRPVQDIGLDTFATLGDRDILFIDSSHVAKIGSDVLFEVFEILPRLGSGCLVHVHDIFLPAEYPKTWVLGEKRFWSEQYLIRAFMTFNDEFEVVWAGSYMHLNYPEKLSDAFPSYAVTPRWPGSLWLRRKPLGPVDATRELPRS